jgi:hypothetical protein
MGGAAGLGAGTILGMMSHSKPHKQYHKPHKYGMNPMMGGVVAGGLGAYGMGKVFHHGHKWKGHKGFKGGFKGFKGGFKGFKGGFKGFK